MSETLSTNVVHVNQLLTPRHHPWITFEGARSSCIDRESCDCEANLQLQFAFNNVVKKNAKELSQHKGVYAAICLNNEVVAYGQRDALMAGQGPWFNHMTYIDCDKLDYELTGWRDGWARYGQWPERYVQNGGTGYNFARIFSFGKVSRYSENGKTGFLIRPAISPSPDRFNPQMGLPGRVQDSYWLGAHPGECPYCALAPELMQRKARNS